jgi:prepilin-type N-terminal cleavage/methylation domain-containing protein
MDKCLDKSRRHRILQARGLGGGGFTLLELLIVISILAVLVALLVPSLARAKLLARQAACQNNLHGVGLAVGFYQGVWGEFIPISWQNVDKNEDGIVNPWKSWRANLLPYTPGFALFNCPAVHGPGTEIFRSDADVTTLDFAGGANTGSYGVVYQYSLPSYTPDNRYGKPAWGHPDSSNVFSTARGVSWRDPGNSVYAADSCFVQGPLRYPTGPNIKGAGSSVILPPSEPFFNYFGTSPTRRFADRHNGTNCLFLGGNVVPYETRILDHMVAGKPDCVWDTE